MKQIKGTASPACPPLSHEVFREQDIFLSLRNQKTVHWSIAWSDLMMTMFIMLLVVYAFFSMLNGPSEENSISRQTEVSVKPESTSFDQTSSRSQEPVSDLPYPAKQTSRLEHLNDIAKVELLDNKAVRIILPGDLLFDTGLADLKGKAEKALNEVAEIIRETPYMVNIVGHTDNVPVTSGRFKSNWDLSSIRACVVTRYLVEKKDLPANRFYVSGHSYNQPLKPNTTPENQAVNRRVEIIISKEMPYSMPGSEEDIVDTDFTFTIR